MNLDILYFNFTLGRWRPVLSLLTEHIYFYRLIDLAHFSLFTTDLNRPPPTTHRLPPTEFKLKKNGRLGLSVIIDIHDTM